MTKIFVIGIFIFWVLIAHPFIFAAAGIVIYIIYLIDKYERGQQPEGIEEDSILSRAKSIYGKFVKDGVVDHAGYHANQSEKRMKSGFRDDPEWQKKSAALRKTMAENKKANEKDVIKESSEETEQFWTKTR